MELNGNCKIGGVSLTTVWCSLQAYDSQCPQGSPQSVAHRHSGKKCRIKALDSPCVEGTILRHV